MCCFWTCVDILLICFAKHLHCSFPLLRAVVNRIVTSTFPELTCVLLQTLSKDIHSWKITAGKHAATAVGHAADAEDVLRKSYSYPRCCEGCCSKAACRAS